MTGPTESTNENAVFEINFKRLLQRCEEVVTNSQSQEGALDPIKKRQFSKVINLAKRYP